MVEIIDRLAILPPRGPDPREVAASPLLHRGPGGFVPPTIRTPSGRQVPLQGEARPCMSHPTSISDFPRHFTRCGKDATFLLENEPYCEAHMRHHAAVEALLLVEGGQVILPSYDILWRTVARFHVSIGGRWLLPSCALIDPPIRDTNGHSKDGILTLCEAAVGLDVDRFAAWDLAGKEISLPRSRMPKRSP